jgi:hypothetical protein
MDHDTLGDNLAELMNKFLWLEKASSMVRAGRVDDSSKTHGSSGFTKQGIGKNLCNSFSCDTP